MECPNGYIVQIPNGKHIGNYIPCEFLNEYIDKLKQGKIKDAEELTFKLHKPKRFEKRIKKITTIGV